MEKSKQKRGQLLVRLPDNDSPLKVSRATLSALSRHLGTTETQVVHIALSRLAREVLPQYEPDEGPLSPGQVEALRRMEPQGQPLTVLSTLF